MMQRREVWKSIPGFTERYQASSLGRIRRINAPSNTPWKERMVLRAAVKAGGYLGTMLTNDKGESKNVYVHILVALAFLGERGEGMEVNHKDFDVANNLPSNLEYTTPKQQGEHRKAAGRYGHSQATRARISATLKARHA